MCRGLGYAAQVFTQPSTEPWWLQLGHGISAVHRPKIANLGPAQASQVFDPGPFGCLVLLARVPCRASTCLPHLPWRCYPGNLLDTQTAEKSFLANAGPSLLCLSLPSATLHYVHQATLLIDKNMRYKHPES